MDIGRRTLNLRTSQVKCLLLFRVIKYGRLTQSVEASIVIRGEQNLFKNWLE